MDQTTHTRPYLRATTVRMLAALALVIGIGWAIGGTAYMVNGMTQAGADVEVHVIPLDSESSGSTDGWVPVDLAAVGDRAQVRASADHLQLSAWDSTFVEQTVARPDAAVTGIAALLIAVLLRHLLLSIADGRPFAPGNPRRIAAIGIIVAIVGVATPLLRATATSLVLTRLGLEDSALAAPGLTLDPVVGLLVLFALAEAFRRGSALADDVRGLV